MNINFLFFAFLVFLKIIYNAQAFNYSDEFYDKDTNHTRNGKFLFDSLFGLELEEELINAAAQNTLKSCDCGKLLTDGDCK